MKKFKQILKEYLIIYILCFLVVSIYHYKNISNKIIVAEEKISKTLLVEDLNLDKELKWILPLYKVDEIHKIIKIDGKKYYDVYAKKYYG